MRALVEGSLEESVLPVLLDQIGFPADRIPVIVNAGGGDRFWRSAIRGFA